MALSCPSFSPVATGSSRRRSHPKRDQPKDPWQPVTEETVLLEPSTTRSDNVYISPDESLLGVKRGSIGRVSEAAPTGRNSKCSRLCLTILVQMVYLTELATLILSFLLLNGASHQIPEFQQFSKIRDGNYLRLVTNHSEDQNIFYRYTLYYSHIICMDNRSCIVCFFNQMPRQ